MTYIASQQGISQWEPRWDKYKSPMTMSDTGTGYKDCEPYLNGRNRPGDLHVPVWSARLSGARRGRSVEAAGRRTRVESCRSGLVEPLLKASVSFPLLHNVNKSGKKLAVRRGARSRAAFFGCCSKVQGLPHCGEWRRMRVFSSYTDFNGSFCFLIILNGDRTAHT